MSNKNFSFLCAKSPDGALSKDFNTVYKHNLWTAAISAVEVTPSLLY